MANNFGPNGEEVFQVKKERNQHYLSRFNNYFQKEVEL